MAQLALDRFNVWRSLMYQRIRENQWFIQAALMLLGCWGFTLAVFQNHERAVAILSQVHRSSRRAWLRRIVEPYVEGHREVFYYYRSREEHSDQIFARNRLLVLKPPSPGGEKGVLLAMFNETLGPLYTCMDIPKLFCDYTVVFEPSWPGFCHRDLLQYTRFPDEIFVLAAVRDDFSFLNRLQSNLVPVDLAPCDWVDPHVAEPYLHSDKEFDIVMNSIWAVFKRHHVLFRMLARSKRRYKVALIGAKWGARSRLDVEREAKYYGVADRLTIFESIPYSLAMEITCKSRVAVHLSLKEAGPRSVAECIFCDVPVVALRSLIAGVAKHVVPETGTLAEESELESAVERLLQANLAPRSWALEHISSLKSTEKLNTVLRLHALSQGRPWTHDIAARTNSPECKYVFSVDAERLGSYNDALKSYVSL